MSQPEFDELNTHRLEHDWTWEQLAFEMARADLSLSARTLHYVCKRLPPDGHALDRTLYKIRKYLELVRAADKRAARRRKVSA